MSPAVLLAILATQTCGGLASIFTKLALQGLEPWTMVFCRQSLGLLILFAMARARPAPPRVPFSRREWGLLLTAAWGGFALPQALLAIGIGRSTGTMGALLTPLEPIGIVIGGVLFLGDRLNLARALAVLLGTAGAVTVVSQGRIAPGTSDPLGDVLIAIGHLSWAIYTVATKPLLARHDPMRVSLAIVALSLVPIGFLAWPEPFDQAPGRPPPQTMRARGAVLETRFALPVVPSEPLVGRLAAHAGGLGRLGHPPAERPNSLDQKPAQGRRQLRVSMQMHLWVPL